LNRDGEADEHFVRAIKLAPNAAEGYFFYGRWLGQKYRRPEAIVYLQQAASANPDYMPARYLLMEMYAEQSDWVRLRGAAESVLLQFPSDATAARFLTRANSPDRESADFRVAEHRRGLRRITSIFHSLTIVSESSRNASPRLARR